MRASQTLAAWLLLAACNRTEVETRVPLWSAQEDLRYTSAAFADVRDIEVGVNGTIYVLSSEPHQILVYNPTIAGGLMSSIGPGGLAPREFKDARALGSAAGLLWVFDQANQWVTLMQGNGDQPRSIMPCRMRSDCRRARCTSTE